MRRYNSLLIFILIFAGVTARADVKLPPVLSDNMVLQRDIQLPIWGQADAGEKVTVKIAGSEVSAVAGSGGKWLVKLPAMKAGGPHEMTISGKNTLTIKNILVGEVWVCSGQSNMHMELEKSENGAEVAAKAANQKLRLYLVPVPDPKHPEKDVVPKWVVCAPASAANFSAVAYYFGRHINKELDVPVGMIASSVPGSAIGGWIRPEGMTGRDEHPAVKPRNKNEILYFTMIRPLVPFGIRGVLWYQGEANGLINSGMQYYPLMKRLIEGWRDSWGQGPFPFYYVQLPPWSYSGYRKVLTPYAMPEVRDAQVAALSITNTGMAVTIDLAGGLHPKKKEEVGRRLALWALSHDYGKKDLVFSGPLYKSFKIEGNKVRVNFDYAEGLKWRNGKDMNRFEIAGEDRKFVPAQGTIEGSTVIVSSSEVSQPVAVRLAWHETASHNLVNGADLPASPFRTDNWPQPEKTDVPAPKGPDKAAGKSKARAGKNQ